MRAASDRPVIEAQRVSKTFMNGKGGVANVLQDVSLRIEEGRFVCIVGPSGCGKSTLLNMFAGLLEPTNGTVFYRGEAVEGINQRAGYITQRDNLLPWRTLERNVELGLELKGVPSAERKRRVHDMLARVGLSGAERLYPSQLSGGMRKRASLARTLVCQPETLLMDEPFAAVDAILRLSLHQMLLSLWEEGRTNVVFVTHDLEEALLLADQIVVLGTDPGRIVYIDDVPFPRPRDIFELRGDPEFGRRWSKLWGYLAAGQSRSAREGAVVA